MYICRQFISFFLFILLSSCFLSLDLKTGTVYKLVCQITGKVFIGGTTLEIEEAMRLNKTNFARYRRGACQGNNRVFEVISNKAYNVSILEIIHELANDTDFSLTLRKRQRFHLEQQNDNAVNKRKPSRTKREYYVEKIDNILQCKKTYYENNREVMSQQNKEKYWDKRESILKQKKVYYSRIKSSLLQKVTCEVCGGVCTKGSLYMHKKSKRHLTALAKFNQSGTSSSEPL